MKTSFINEERKITEHICNSSLSKIRNCVSKNVTLKIMCDLSINNSATGEVCSGESSGVRLEGQRLGLCQETNSINP